MNQKFYYQDKYQELFMKFPLFLMTNPKYERLSDSAKIVYVLLRDRFKYSVKNKWIDEDGAIYFIYTNRELMHLLHKSEPSVIKIKKELQKFNLLLQKRMGCNRPNRLYLLQPELTAHEVYQLDEAKFFSSKGTKENSAHLEAVKNEVSEMESSELRTSDLETTGTEETLVNQEADNFDTNQIQNDTAQLDFSKSKYSTAQIQMQNNDLMQHAHEFLVETDDLRSYILNKKGTYLLAKWCQTPAQRSKLVGIILTAKKKAQEELRPWKQEAVLDFDDPYVGNGENHELKQLITLTLQRYFNAIREGEDVPGKQPIRNHESYLFTTMMNMFSNYAQKQIQEGLAEK